jgi:hypothetical protein
MFRDEADVAPFVVRHMLDEGCYVLVADNMSTDGTRQILDQIAASEPRLIVVDDLEVGYYQDRKMTALGQQAAEWGATWIVPFDADEWWYSPVGRLADVLTVDVPADVLKAFGWDHRPHQTDDQTDRNPFTRMRWREPDTQKFPCVAYRPHPDAWLHMGNHDIDRSGRRVAGLLEYRHFGFRSFEQMRRKVRQGKQAYDATDLPYLHGTHWREMGAMSDAELSAEWERLSTRTLVYDPCPR